MSDDPQLFEIFLDVQRGLPRQGPGCEESTRRALSLCQDLPDRPAVLDVGCGPGLQTLVLAEALNGPVTAVDLTPEYLDQLQAKAEVAGLADRIEIVSGDMTALPFPPQSFDLIWSEGAAYVMGFAEAFTAWRALLKPAACIAVSELVWLVPDPPSEAAALFAEEYPAMTDVETNLEAIRDRGYELLGHFTLPDEAWWTHYYTPLATKLPGLLEKYAGDDEALSVVETTHREIDMRRRFGQSYGYEFFIAQKAS